jgi:hypothetical protein
MAKNYFRNNFVFVSLLAVLVMGFYVFNPNQVKANTVEFAEDTVLELEGLDTTIYFGAGSEADYLTISGKNLHVYEVWNGIPFLLKTSEHKVLQVTPSGGTANFSFSSDYLTAGYLRRWTATNSVSTNFVIGAPVADADYIIKVNGIEITGSPFNSGSGAEVNFNRTGSGASEVYTISGPGFACARHNIWGWAWSDNIGWLSFSCENENEVGEGFDYGVDIFLGETKNMSGYAWSENVGWIDLSPLGPYPDTPNYSTTVDLETGGISGWARALSYGGSWDGWISMSGDNYGVSVDFDEGELSGFAWSDEVIGWLSFNCANEGVCGTVDYKVLTSFSPAPSITNLTNEFPAPCSQSRIPTFSWETDAELPYDYEIRLCGNSDCTDPGDPLVLELVESTSSTSWAPACVYTCSTSPYNNISFGGGTYYGQVRARNTGGRWSGWSASGFTTHNHAYPYADFLCDGANCEEMQIYEDVIVTLANSSTTYDGLVSCSWTLPAIAEVVEGNPETDCELQVKFSPPPPGQREQDIELSVIDSSSYSCSTTKTVEVRFPLPEYKETSPVGWFKNFFLNLLAKTTNIFVKY